MRLPSHLRNLQIFVYLLLFLAIQSNAQSVSGTIPARPRDLKFSPLSYEPPIPSRYRQVLSNGVVAYLVEDHDFPLVNVSVLIQTGHYLDPKGKEGLAAMMANQMRAGGTANFSADAFDEEAAFLAANISSTMSEI